MSQFRSFRVGHNFPTANEIEFYFKIEGDDGQVIGNFAVCGDGIYYYRTGSWVLTPDETAQTLETYDGFLSFEKLKQLFEKIVDIGWSLSEGDDSNINIEKAGHKIVLSRTSEE